MANLMAVEAMSDGLIEGWTKLGLFALVLTFVLGLVFLLMKFSKRAEKPGGRKRRVDGMNREQRRYERSIKRRKRGH